MDNKYGPPAFETFFLVLPKDLKISKSNSPTGSQELLNFNVYWWTKQLQQGEAHTELVQLDKEYVVIADELPVDKLQAGDESATKDYIKSVLGTPEKEVEKYLDYKKKYRLGFFVDGYLKEIRIEPGFKGRFANGLTMESTTSDIFRVFGEPEKTVETYDLRKERKPNFLYRRKDGIGRICYENGHFVFWLKEDTINQIASDIICLTNPAAPKSTKEK